MTYHTKNRFLLLVLCLFELTLTAQQLPQFTQFPINPYLVNPAVAGTEDFVHIQAGYRSQWTGFDDAPRTAYFSAHSTINNRAIGYRRQKLNAVNRVTLGTILTNDRTGPLKQSSAAATFAYNFALSDDGLRFSFGINGGVKRFSYNPQGYTDNVRDLDDPTIQQMVSRNLLNFAAGFWIYNDHFFAGGSSFQFFSTRLKAGSESEALLPEEIFLRHYYFMTGYKLPVGHRNYLVPSLLVKTVTGAPVSFDINAKLVVDDRYWIGSSYRKDDSMAVFAGLLLSERLEISYSYDLLYSKLRNASAGSSEIHLGYRLFHNNQIACPDRFW